MSYRSQLNQIKKRLESSGLLLKGTLIDRRIRCGKPNCRCQDGTGHPGLYLTYSLRGKTKTVYISKKMASEARQWAKNYARFKSLLEKMFQIQLKLIKGGK